jgi:type IV pilus assembly protein PilX
MTTHLQHSRSIAPRQQQGIALVMAIIMLIIATLIGLAGIRHTSLQEKLSGNLYDRAIAMQSAEFALGQAEKWLFETEGSAITGTATVIDCSTPSAACPAVPANTFTTSSTNWVSVTLPSTFNNALNAGDPQYFIQYLGLKNSDANIDVDDAGSNTQYGTTGGNSVSPQNATYRVTVRSSTPTADNDRSIVVLTSLVKGN